MALLCVSTVIFLSFFVAHVRDARQPGPNTLTASQTTTHQQAPINREPLLAGQTVLGLR